MLGTVNILYFNWSYRWVLVSHCDLICIFPMANCGKHLFMCLLPSIYFFGEMSVKCFAYFLIGLIVFKSFKFLKYSLGKSPLSDM